MIGDNMAECNVSIDKNKLPGVKEVCRDFAVLEDHCLAYNLQEQEIESHLASNVHKSRLVQNDLQVAKKLQEEEDQRAKIRIRKQHDDIVRQDTEIAQEIQDQLVRQAEQQRKQEEKDAAIARRLQEKEMKEERRRQKQLEANFEEEYFEDHGAKRRPFDVDKDTRHNAPTSYRREYSPNYNSVEAKRSRNPKQDPGEPHSRSKYADGYLEVEGGRSRHADPYPDSLHSRGKHGDSYPENEPTEVGRPRSPRGVDADSVVRRKERPTRPPPPTQIATERGRDTHRDRDGGRDREWESHAGKEHKRDGEPGRGRCRERSQEKALSGDRLQDRDRQRPKDKQRARTRSSERDIDADYLEPVHSGNGFKVAMVPWEGGEETGERERSGRVRQRVHSGPDEVFEEHRISKGRADTREILHPRQEEGPGRQHSHAYPSEDTGQIVHKASGALVTESESKLNEASKGMAKLNLREQELKDMEVARKLQDEEVKASKMMEVRAAQVAQDGEIARLLMEQEKKEYRKNREREKEKERMAMDRRWQEGDARPQPEEVVRPRTREEAEYYRQKHQIKPARPPQPRSHDYENVSSPYGYPDQPAPARPASRPEAAYKGAYHKR